MLERCHRNYVQSWWEMNRSLPGARIQTWNDGTAMASSIPSSLANTLFVMRRPDDVNDLIERARAFFESNPWRVLANAQSRDAIASAVGTTMKPRRGDPGMLMFPLGEAPPYPASLRIERVSEQAQLADLRKATSKAFGIPTFVVKTMFPSIPAETDPVVLLVGYEGGEPAASAVSVVLEGMVGINTVGVRPRSRRRGYGRAMTWAAVEVGRERGCDSSYLEASEMGLPVYSHMGFKVVSEYPEWHASVSKLKMARALFHLLGTWLRGRQMV
jgi:ribosomal protein S18 acetylase RimI-like enzyme